MLHTDGNEKSGRTAVQMKFSRQKQLSRSSDSAETSETRREEQPKTTVLTAMF